MFSVKNVLFILSVIGIRSVFAQEMLLLHMSGCGGSMRIYLAGEDDHSCHLFQHYGMVYRLGRVLSPGKGAVTAADHPRHMNRIDSARLKGFDDHLAGVEFVALFYLCRCEGTTYLRNAG